MRHLLNTIATAAFVAALSVAPAIAQDPGAASCSDYAEMTPEQQMEAVTTLIMEKMDASASDETNEEVHSMLLEKCQQFPDQSVGSQFDDIPLAMD